MADDGAISMLESLGFPRASVMEALRVSDNNVEVAANYLLTHGAAAPAAHSALGPHSHSRAASASADLEVSQVEMVHGAMSQYSVEAGRSACTCVALAAAQRFLEHPKKMDESFLEQAITEGTTIYTTRIRDSSEASSSSNPNRVEHSSAEEVLATKAFPGLRLMGAVRQGILSKTHNADLRQQLLDCRSPSEWTCVLMTKTPETVSLCLPPEGNDAAYILVDSHPRQSQFDAHESYARLHPTLDDLLVSLAAIFPPTELGPDIPELMAAMYNSYDLYPLRLANR